MLAIISGSGDLPVLLCDILQKRGCNFIVIDISDKSQINHNKNYQIFKTEIGKIGRILQILSKNKINDLLFIGGISRPSFSDMKFDLTGIYWYFKIYKTMKKGDDTLLTTILKMLQKKGFGIKSIKDTAPELLSSNESSVLSPSKQNLQDIEIGKQILQELSKYDIGQSIIIQNGLVIGIEAIEGTDQLILRSKNLKRNTKTGGVLIKMPKINQSELIDLPTIGLTTIKNAHQAGLDGIAIKKGTTIIVHKNQVLKLAEKLGIFITLID